MFDRIPEPHLRCRVFCWLTLQEKIEMAATASAAISPEREVALGAMKKSQ
jgi:hypothetical protein